MSNCHCNSDIILDGSGQLGRYLKALDPSYAPIDDRSIEDLLVFAKRYAGQIRFYDIPDSHITDGVKPGKVNWREFFRRDMAVIAASVAVLNIRNIKKEYDELRERLDADPSPEKLEAAFSLCISIATRIDRWYTVAIPENPLRIDLDLAINSHLRWQMKRIMAYEDGYKFIDSKNPLNIDYSGIENDELWGLKDPVNADATIYQGSNLDDKIRYGALYADDIFNDFFSTLQSFIDKGPGYMTFALEQYPAHQPNMALFIAFLQIFKLAQEQMNGLTGRMLDFYYKEVLQLTPKDSIPDKTHIVFELAKDIAQYDLAAGTALSAGKDASGKEQAYKTATDLVLNQAKVKELKTIFIEKEKSVVANVDISTIKSIYARPVANSADGYGEPLTEANPKWPTFGVGLSKGAESINICKQLDNAMQNALAAPPVQTGFAIASPQLVLQGGKRLIALNVPGINKVIKGNKENTPFSIWLTSDKGWLKVDKMMILADINKFMKLFALGHSVFNPETDTLETSYFIDEDRNTIYVYLPIAENPVIAYDAKLHAGYNYKTAYPVMQVMLNEKMKIDEKTYNTIPATGLSLEIRVGTINPGGKIRKNILDNLKINIPEYNFDGLKTVVTQNAEGLFPSDKPFNPFTQYPGPGKSLYIGSAEVFNKPLNQLAVNLNRTQQHLEQEEEVESVNLNAVDINDSKPFGVSILTKRSWRSLPPTEGKNFNQTELTENILNISKQDTNEGLSIPALIMERTPIETVTEFKSQVTNGFLKIDYLLPLSRRDGQISTMQASQELALRLEIKEISVNYYSELKKLDSSIDQLFHVYPFGVVETYFGEAVAMQGSIRSAKAKGSSFAGLDLQKDNLLVDARNLLLPQYNFLDAYGSFAKNKNAVNDHLNRKVSVLESLVKTRSGITKILGVGNNQYSDSKQEQGMLFIGLEKAVPLQSVSLLFQFAEGSAEDEDKDPPEIHWSYLTNNEWRPMRGEDIVSDGTYGFQTTGIVKLNIPADATRNNTIITQGLHWFAVSVTENPHRIPQLVNVITQAAEVVFEDNDNDQKHFDNALPAGSITKLAVKVAQVSKVEQPFASFDGKHKEISKEFYTRISERLRHKNRAINSWDYEHLVLDRFPSVYKVKCITATDPNCLCRESVVVSVAATENKRNYKVEIAGAEGLDIERVDPTDAGLKNIEAAINDLVSNPNATLQVTLYAKTNAMKKFAEAIAVNIKQSIKKKFDKEKIAEDRIKTVIANSGGAINIIDMDVISPAEKAIAGEAVCCGPQIAPGHVLLVPIANLKNRNSINPLQPKTSRRVLLEMEDYLKKLTSPFVKVHAKNPVYEQVIVGFKVQFYTGTDQGFYLKKLNEEIVQYLTPWAFDENADVQFGQKIYASSIINFIEERPYVDFITDFVMGVCKDECCKPDTAAATRKIQPAEIKADAAATVIVAGVVNMKGVITDSKTGNSIEGAAITIQGAATSVSTAADGSFAIDLDPATAVLIVKAKYYKDAVAAVVGLSDFRLAMIRADETNDDSISETLAGICGCDSIETQMGKEAAERGEIVAKPSTARSILVSVPQHVIIPYTPLVKQTPCDVRKKNKHGAVATATEATGEKVASQKSDVAKDVVTDKAKELIAKAAVKKSDKTTLKNSDSDNITSNLKAKPDRKKELPLNEADRALQGKNIKPAKTTANKVKVAKPSVKKVASVKPKKNNN